MPNWKAFSCSDSLQAQATMKTHSYKKRQVCYAMGVRTPSGNPLKAVWHYPDCPDQPGLCPGEWFKMFCTKFDFTK